SGRLVSSEKIDSNSCCGKNSREGMPAANEMHCRAVGPEVGCLLIKEDTDSLNRENLSCHMIGAVPAGGLPPFRRGSETLASPLCPLPPLPSCGSASLVDSTRVTKVP